MKKKWILKEKIPTTLLTQYQGRDPMIAQLLYNRGLRDTDSIERFFNTRYDSLSSPFLMTGIKPAVERILQALANDEKITIYADYDADAVTACSVMYRGLVQLGAKQLATYIPDRFTEGYGLNEDAMRQIASDGTRLMITVDCGINAVEEVASVTARGVDVIITDHHHITGELPKAFAVVNQKQDRLPDLEGLTGVGVAFKLIQALFFSLFPDGYEAYNWEPSGVDDSLLANARARSDRTAKAHWEKWLLDLVAIGTIADCQSVMGENRILVKYGLQVMPKTRWPGLKQLIRNAGVDEYKEFDSFTVGFIVAPRINAAGRIQHADIAFRLFASDDPGEISLHAGQLESLNQHRQRLTEQIFSEARAQAELQRGDKILVAVGQDWPKGVVGLVASRLSEEFWRPAVVLERSETQATGSARSIGAFNIVEAFGAVRQHLVRYGGHAQAAGLTIQNGSIEKFRQTLLAYAEEHLTDTDLERREEVDMEMEPQMVTRTLVRDLKSFEPFGPGNPSVRFLLRGMHVENISPVGKTGKHVRIQASKNGSVFRFIGFGKGHLLKILVPGDTADIVIEPSENTWNGRTEIQMKIIDIKKS